MIKKQDVSKLTMLTVNLEDELRSQLSSFRFVLRYLGLCFTPLVMNYKVAISALRLSEYELFVKRLKNKLCFANLSLT